MTWHQFSLADLRHHKNIHLHGEQIRDVKFSDEGGNVSYTLSTGFDKTLKVKRKNSKEEVDEGWLCASTLQHPHSPGFSKCFSTRTLFEEIAIFSCRYHDPIQLLEEERRGVAACDRRQHGRSKFFWSHACGLGDL